jgi:hypothetical protein
MPGRRHVVVTGKNSLCSKSIDRTSTCVRPSVDPELDDGEMSNGELHVLLSIAWWITLEIRDEFNTSQSLRIRDDTNPGDSGDWEDC